MTSESAGDAASVARGVGWVRLDARYRWEDLVLPEGPFELLRSISADVRLRERPALESGAGRGAAAPRGLRVLFAGEPGTGRRMAARILGAELDLAVFSVDLEEILAAEPIGAAHRRDRLFAAAELAHALLYLNDAEAWFGKSRPQWSSRDDATQQAAAQMLRRIDRYRGIVVFASTLRSEFDDEFVESFDVVVEFPFPVEGARREIWQRQLPPGARIGDDGLDFLADSFQLPGGAIRAAALAAAAAATSDGGPVEMSHVIDAVEQEYAGRIQGARTRQAFQRFRAGSWSVSPTAPAPELAAPPVRQPGRVRGAQPATPAAARPPLQINRRLAAFAIAAAIAAAVAGFLIARSPGTSSPATTALGAHATAGLLRVSYPTGWRRTALPRRPRLGLSDELAVAPPARGSGTVVVGRAPTAYPDLLPASVLAGVAATPAPKLVTLDGRPFYRYLGLKPRAGGAGESAYALPTSIGTVLGVCFEAGAAPSFASTCERVVGSVRLVSGRVLAIGPSASYASQLNDVMSALDSARAPAAAQLAAARTPTAQATAAGQIASAYRDAASAVGRLDAGPAKTANQAVSTGLSATAGAYAALGRAATGNDATAYDAARASITNATNALRSAFAKLSTLGYLVS